MRSTYETCRPDLYDDVDAWPAGIFEETIETSETPTLATVRPSIYDGASNHGPDVDNYSTIRRYELDVEMTIPALYLD